MVLSFKRSFKIAFRDFCLTTFLYIGLAFIIGLISVIMYKINMILYLPQRLSLSSDSLTIIAMIGFLIYIIVSKKILERALTYSYKDFYIISHNVSYSWLDYLYFTYVKPRINFFALFFKEDSFVTRPNSPLSWGKYFYFLTIRGLIGLGFSIIIRIVYFLLGVTLKNEAQLLHIFAPRIFSMEMIANLIASIFAIKYLINKWPETFTIHLKNEG